MNEWAASLAVTMYGEAPQAYPTKQMTNRGHYMSLIGVIILAIFSSLSSYSSLLNGYNFNVHIGNAISLSLVPPVMNCVSTFSSELFCPFFLLKGNCYVRIQWLWHGWCEKELQSKINKIEYYFSHMITVLANRYFKFTILSSLFIKSFCAANKARI